MQLNSPQSLLVGLLAIPILILYLLKLRRQNVEVASIFLWDKFVRDREANSPWQQLKKSILLILQLLILSALALALAQPFFASEIVESGNMVVVLDASASMQATDEKPTRFDAGTSQIVSIINNMASDATMSIVFAGQKTRVIANQESNKNTLKSVIKSLNPENGEADWETALAAAVGMAKNTKHGEIIIVSDGGVQAEIPFIRNSEINIRHILVGLTDNNISINSFSARETAEGIELYASIKNQSKNAKKFLLSLSSNGNLLSAQYITLPAYQKTEIILPGIQSDQKVFNAKLQTINNSDLLDDFSLDNFAWATSNTKENRKVLLISNGNLFIQQLLSAIPYLQGYLLIPIEGEDLVLPPEKYDLYIFDGIIPSSFPDTNLIIINPTSNQIFPVEGIIQTPANQVINDHLLTRHVSWKNIQIKSASKIQLPDWGETLVESNGDPLVFYGNLDGNQIAVFSFDFHNSDFPLNVDFPILMSNLFARMIPEYNLSSFNLLPGNSIEIIPTTNVTNISIQNPAGITTQLPINQSNVVFNETNRIGPYMVSFTNADVKTDEFFTVNLFSETESIITPSQINWDTYSSNTSIQNETGRIDVWSWILVTGFIFLLLEWVIYHKRFRFFTN